MPFQAFTRHCVAVAVLLCCLTVGAQTNAPTEPEVEKTNKNNTTDPSAAIKPVAQPKNGSAQLNTAPERASEPTLGRVEVIGANSETDQRRASTAAKIIIGKDDIERYGDSSVSEVLKRLPGVTTGGRPGRGGDVRMRGMGGGYTQLLVNGERMPPGFSLDNLTPDQVERIEVMRAPTAEFGARAVAGTINVVLKEALKKTLNEVRVGAGFEIGRASPSASWTRNDKFGESVSYTLTASVNRSNTRDENDTRTRWTDLSSGEQVLDQHEIGFTTSERDGVHLNGRIQVPLAPGEVMILMPFLMVSQSTSGGYGQLVQQPGGTIPPPFASYSTVGESRFRSTRGSAQWQKSLGDGVKIELRGGVSQGAFDNQSSRNEYDLAGLLTRRTDDQSTTKENGWNLTSKASLQLENEHSIVGGLEFDSSTRRQSRTTLQDGLPILTEFGEDLNARSLRMAAYLQDEWSPTKQISAYAGLRWEGIETRSDSDVYQVNNQSNVLTPLLHATWRPDEKSRNQWRSSLTRSYKSASLQDLIARPSISNRFPNGANEVGSPDRAGNPGLAPELARGFEIAYEHYLEKGGLISANFFYRHISDLIRSVVALEDVTWSPDKRWVSRPQNVGNAIAQGIELEAKFRLDEIWSDAMAISLRSNVSVFDSRVDKVTGPNNRLEGQPRGSANLGADYKLRALPISFGANANFTPAYDLQLSDIQSISVGTKVVADAFLVWFINPNAQLRVSANNMLPRDYATSVSTLNGTQRQTNDSANQSNIRWGARLELKL
jgi:iron complex outermembrane receptor protein